MLNGSRAEHLPEFESNSPLALPEADWEKIKIGAETPPVLCKYGWLLVYHGVHQIPPVGDEPHHLVYSTGIMILDVNKPDKILYRSPFSYTGTNAYRGKDWNSSKCCIPDRC